MTDGLDSDVKEYLKTLTADTLEVKEKVNEIHVALAVLTNEVAAACKRYDRVYDDVEGNGHDGLKNDVQVLKTKMSAIQWIGTTLIGGTVSSLGTAIWALIRK